MCRVVYFILARSAEKTFFYRAREAKRVNYKVATIPMNSSNMHKYILWSKPIILLYPKNITLQLVITFSRHLCYLKCVTVCLPGVGAQHAKNHGKHMVDMVALEGVSSLTI